jgi:hypothetical protein
VKFDGLHPYLRYRFISLFSFSITIVFLFSGCSFASGGFHQQSYRTDTIQLLDSPFAKFLMEETSQTEQAKPAEPQDEYEGPGAVSVLWTTLMYLPNRVFDVLDIVRLRLRVGPGFAAGFRVTKPLSLYAGAYMSVYAGLPGPRQRTKIPWPVGLESHSGIGASLLDFAPDGRGGPQYSPTEVEIGGQLLILGIDVGVDAYEVFDLLAGLILFDPRNDDF